MISLEKCKGFLDHGFSLITVSNNKIPNFTWKAQQENPLSKEEFERRYRYNGGQFKTDGTERPKTENVGLVTGYDYLECIDVDLKVLSTAQEKKDFWNEYIQLLEDNILDFYDKFFIVKTMNEGYHLLYKTKRVEGCKKISKLKGHTEAIIETKGIGGYVFLYPENSINEKNYFDIKFISDTDREVLMILSEGYNYIEPVKDTPPKKVIKEYEESGIKTWDDYNNQTDIFDVIGQDFTNVRNERKKYHIKRNGAKSSHSGYVFKDTNGMYLFSTGSIYEAKKYYTPFSAYACKYHNNDFSETAKDLYKKGYGDRIKIKQDFELPEINIRKEDLEFPIDIFSESIQNYLLQCADSLNNSIDYMACSLLFTTSICMGNSIKLQVKNKWQEPAIIWVALVGKPGLGKTPSMKSIIRPLEDENKKAIKSYVKEYKKYEDYVASDNNEKKLKEKINKPNKTQFIVDDITLEALVDLHNENENGVGIKKEELSGWIKDMNKYRSGSDLEQWINSWSNGSIYINRKTAKSSFVSNAFLPVIGGIQPKILDLISTEEYKDSGFIDRLLFCYPDLEPKKYSENEISMELSEWFDNFVIGFKGGLKKNIKYNIDHEIEPHIAYFNPDAKKEWIRIHDALIDVQLSDYENEYTKSMIPKQLSYIPRFALILNTLDSFENEQTPLYRITKESILKAEKLSNYFIGMAKKIEYQSKERKQIKKVLSQSSKKNNYDRFLEIYNENISVKNLAESLDVDVRTIYRFIKKNNE